ncbi:unnamed protein product [Chrysoparadoxa australica]
MRSVLLTLALLLLCFCSIGAGAGAGTRNKLTVEAGHEPERGSISTDTARLCAPLESRRAYVTSLTKASDHVLGARVLARSLRDASVAAEIVVLVSSDRADPGTLAALRRDGLIVHVVQQEQEELSLINPDGHSPSSRVPSELLTLLYLWRMSNFDRVVYLDSRTLVQRTPDMLFACEGFCAAPMDHSSRFSSSVMVIEPDLALHHRMMADALAEAERGSLRSPESFLAGYIGAVLEKAQGSLGVEGPTDFTECPLFEDLGQVGIPGSSSSLVGDHQVLLLNAARLPKCGKTMQRSAPGVCRRLPYTYSASSEDFHQEGVWASTDCVLCNKMREPHIIRFEADDRLWDSMSYLHKPLFWRWNSFRNELDNPYGNVLLPWVLFCVPCLILLAAWVYHGLASGRDAAASAAAAGVLPITLSGHSGKRYRSELHSGGQGDHCSNSSSNSSSSSSSSSAEAVDIKVLKKTQVQMGGGIVHSLSGQGVVLKALEQGKGMARSPTRVTKVGLWRKGEAEVGDRGRSSSCSGLEKSKLRGGGGPNERFQPANPYGGGPGTFLEVSPEGRCLPLRLCYVASVIAGVLGWFWYNLSMDLSKGLVDGHWHPMVSILVYHAWLCCALVLGLYVVDYSYFVLATRGRTLAKDVPLGLLVALAVKLHVSKRLAWAGSVGCLVMLLGCVHSSRSRSKSLRLSSRGHFRWMMGSCALCAALACGICYSPSWGSYGTSRRRAAHEGVMLTHILLVSTIYACTISGKALKREFSWVAAPLRVRSLVLRPTRSCLPAVSRCYRVSWPWVAAVVVLLASAGVAVPWLRRWSERTAYSRQLFSNECLISSEGYLSGGSTRFSSTCGPEERILPVSSNSYSDSFRQDKVCLRTQSGRFVTLKPSDDAETCHNKNSFVFQPATQAPGHRHRPYQDGFCIYNAARGLYLTSQSKLATHCGETEQWRIQRSAASLSFEAVFQALGGLLHPLHASSGPGIALLTYLWAGLLLMQLRNLFGWLSLRCSKHVSAVTKGSKGSTNVTLLSAKYWLCLVLRSACMGLLLAGIWCIVPVHLGQAFSVLTIEHHQVLASTLENRMNGWGQGPAGASGLPAEMRAFQYLGGALSAEPSADGAGSSESCSSVTWLLVVGAIKLHLALVVLAFSHAHISSARKLSGVCWGLAVSRSELLRMRVALVLGTCISATLHATTPWTYLLRFDGDMMRESCRPDWGLDGSWMDVSPLVMFQALYAGGFVYCWGGTTRLVQRCACLLMMFVTAAMGAHDPHYLLVAAIAGAIHFAARYGIFAICSAQVRLHRRNSKQLAYFNPASVMFRFAAGKVVPILIIGYLATRQQPDRINSCQQRDRINSFQLV